MRTLHSKSELMATLFVLSLLLVPTISWAGMGAPATLSGIITESGSGDPLENVTVAVSDIDQAGWGWPVAEATTDPSGHFSVDVPMDPGQTRSLIVEAAGPSHAPGRYDGVSETGCFFDCGGDSGSFNVSEGGEVSELDFSLEPGGAISGTVVASNTGAPIENAIVEPRRSEDGHGISQHFSALTDTDGNYQSPLALAPGEYHFLAGPGSTDNYVVKAWQDYSCQHSRCPILLTDTVELTGGTVVSDIDFDLRPGASISGDLLPDDIVRTVRLYDAAGLLLDDVLFLPFDLPASQWSFDGLAGGSYYIELAAQHSEPYVRLLHNSLICPFGNCKRTSGEPVIVSPGASKALDEMTLEKGGQIGGKIVDAATGEAPPVDGQGLVGLYEIINASGEVLGGGSINEQDGDVVLSPRLGVPPGDYYVRTFNIGVGSGIGYDQPGFVDRATITGYTDAVYPDIPCAGNDCNLDAATAVTVVSGEITDITIEVSSGSNITGSIVDDETEEPISAAIVKLVDADNRQLAATSTGVDGNFVFGGFPAGTYYLRTSMSGQLGSIHYGFRNAYFDRVHGADQLCSEQLCDPAAGTPLTLDGSNDVGPLELRVERGPVIRGIVIDAQTGLKIHSGHVEVFDEENDFVGRYAIPPQSAIFQTSALNSGDYTLVPVVSPAFSDATIYHTALPQTTAETRQQPSRHLVITIDSEDVDVDLYVMDDGINLLFSDRFETD